MLERLPFLATVTKRLCLPPTILVLRVLLFLLRLFGGRHFFWLDRVGFLRLGSLGRARLLGGLWLGRRGLVEGIIIGVALLLLRNRVRISEDNQVKKRVESP